MPPSGARRTLAQALTRLIDEKAKREGEASVADQAIGEAIGKSRTTVWKLRTGQEVNPKVETLEALARYFGVRVAHFLDEDDVADDELAALAAARRLREAGEKHGVPDVNARLAGLSPVALAAVARLIERLGDPERSGDPEGQVPSDVD